MAVDRPSGEAVEQQRAADAPPPPPPPDTPGAEGFPSRAESKAFAAAAADKSQRRDDADDRSDTSSTPDAAGDEQDTSRTDRAEPEEAPDRDGPETREDGAADRSYDSDHGSQDEGQEQLSSSEETKAVSTVDDDRASETDTTAQPDVADPRQPYGEEIDTGEQPIPVDAPAGATDDQRPDDLSPSFDRLETDLGEALSESDSRAGATVTATSDGQQANGPADAQQAGDSPDVSPDPVDRSDDAVIGSTDSVDVPGHADDLDDRAVPTRQDGADETGSLAEDRRPGFVDTGQAVATGESPMPGGSGDDSQPPDLPTGQELLEMEGDDESQVDKLRRELYERCDDLFDVTAEVAEEADGIFHRPPTDSYAAVRPDHTVMTAPHDGVQAGEAATALLAGGIVMAELVRWVYGKVNSKERS